MDHKVKHFINLLIIVGLLFAVSISPASGHSQLSSSSSQNPPEINSPQQPTIDKTYGEYAELVNQLGGTSDALAISGQHAYIGMGPRLGVVDFTDLANPQLVSKSELTWGFVSLIEVQSPFVYVVSYVPSSPYGDMLTIFDITNASDPVQVSETWIGPGDGSPLLGDKKVGCSARSGNYLFLCQGSMLLVFDVTDPTNPQNVSIYSNGSLINDISINNHYAYLAINNFSDSGLEIADIQDPTDLHHSGFFKTGTEVFAVSAVGGYAYLITDYDFQVIQVVNPVLPELVGIIASSNFGYWSSIQVKGSTVYVIHCDLDMVDVSDPTHPDISENIYDFTDCSTRLQVLPGTSPNQILGYFSHRNIGLSLLDLTDQENITPLSQFTDPPGWVDRIKISGDYAYLTGNGFSSWDLSNPANPTLLAQPVIPGWLSDLESHFAYVVNSETNVDPLAIIDISDPANPTQNGSYSTPGDIDYIGNVDVLTFPDDHLYAFISTSHNLRVADVTVPSAVSETGVYTTTDYIVDITTSGPDSHGNFFAYLSDYPSKRIEIVDITDPHAPLQAGQIFFDSSNGGEPPEVMAAQVAGSQTFLYWVSPSGPDPDELYIEDVSDPAHPTLTSRLTGISGHYSRSIELAGSYAYLAQDAGNLQIVDVSDPLNPRLAGYLREPTDTYDVAVKGNFVYLGDWDGGLYVGWFGPGVQKEIPTNGGTITSPFDATSYLFASGTFTDTVTITHTPRYAPNLPSTGGLAATGHSFEVKNYHDCCDVEIQPTLPFTVTVQYSPDQIILNFESSLALYSWDGMQWIREPTSSLDTLNHTVTAHPDHFSTFALLQSQLGVYLPLLRH